LCPKNSTPHLRGFFVEKNMTNSENIRRGSPVPLEEITLTPSECPVFMAGTVVYRKEDGLRAIKTFTDTSMFDHNPHIKETRKKTWGITDNHDV